MKHRTIRYEDLQKLLPDFVPVTSRTLKPEIPIENNPKCKSCGSYMIFFEGDCCSNTVSGYKCPNPNCSV